MVNGGFETGTLAPWVGVNTTVTSEFSHSGFFSARLFGGTFTSYITQFVGGRSRISCLFGENGISSGALSHRCRLLILTVDLIFLGTAFLRLCLLAEYQLSKIERGWKFIKRQHRLHQAPLRHSY
ncbi:hypothetical protein P9D55_20310 [Bacillus sonorensis]|nr:hypothetical protein [Bacillus sonorensis]